MRFLKYFLPKTLFSFALYIEEEGDPGYGIFDFEEEGSQGEQTPPGGEKPPEKNPPPQQSELDALKERHEKLERSYKDQQEYVRQLTGDLNDLKDFKGKITGVSDEEKKKLIEKELVKQYETDPMGYIDSRIEEKAKQLNEYDTKMRELEGKMLADTLMRELDDEYDIDWEKDGQAIAEKLKYFSAEARRDMPKDVLKSAARLAGKLKPKSRNRPKAPYMEGSGSAPGYTKKEAQDVANGILNAGRRRLFKKN